MFDAQHLLVAIAPAAFVVTAIALSTSLAVSAPSWPPSDAKLYDVFDAKPQDVILPSDTGRTDTQGQSDVVSDTTAEVKRPGIGAEDTGPIAPVPSPLAYEN